MSLNSITNSPLSRALRKCRSHFVLAALLSAAGNILYLTPTLFMMQVYDRVVPTGGMATLAALALIATLGLAAMSAFEWLRGRVLLRASAQLEAELASPALGMAMSRNDLSAVEAGELLRDFDSFRQGISSSAALAALDAPWTIIYIGAAFLLHPLIGALTVAASLLLLALAWLNERATAPAIGMSSELSRMSYARLAHATQHAVDARALGMSEALTAMHASEREVTNHFQVRAGMIGVAHGSVIKFVRLFLQSAALGLAAILVVRHELSGGAMIAATLLLARAVAPIEQIVAGWKSIVQTRAAHTRLTKAFATWTGGSRTQLPEPTGKVQVERLTVLVPRSDRVAIVDINFEIEPGEVVAVIGPSGAGKSTLLRALAGAIDPVRGTVRFDGAARSDWNEAQLTRMIGYLPQNYPLFPGTVRDNISRFQRALGADSDCLDAAVVSAAQAIDAHDMILRLPKAYDTEIGLGDVGLSSGQTQRVALARALFGSPRIMLLDEPTANLDTEARNAFIKLVNELRARQVTVIFSSHDTEVIAIADRMLMLDRGTMQQLERPLDRLRSRVNMLPPHPLSFVAGGTTS